MTQNFKYKALLSRCNFQPYLSSGFFPERKSGGKKKQQKGRHRPLLFLCRAIQGNRFRAGLLTLSGVCNTGGFSAAKLFYNLQYRAYHHAGHSCRLRNRACEKASAARTHTHKKFPRITVYNADFRCKTYETILFKEGL